MATKNIAIAASTVDADINLGFYVGPEGWPAGLRMRLVIKRDDGKIETSEVLASAIPLTLSGITQAQAAAFLKDCRNAAIAAAGYK